MRLKGPGQLMLSLSSCRLGPAVSAAGKGSELQPCRALPKGVEQARPAVTCPSAARGLGPARRRRRVHVHRLWYVQLLLGLVPQCVAGNGLERIVHVKVLLQQEGARRPCKQWVQRSAAWRPRQHLWGQTAGPSTSAQLLQTPGGLLVRSIGAGGPTTPAAMPPRRARPPWPRCQSGGCLPWRRTTAWPSSPTPAARARHPRPPCCPAPQRESCRGRRGRPAGSGRPRQALEGGLGAAGQAHTRPCMCPRGTKGAARASWHGHTGWRSARPGGPAATVCSPQAPAVRLRPWSLADNGPAAQPTPRIEAGRCRGRLVPPG